MEFEHDPASMAFNRSGAKTQQCCDLFVGVSLCEEPDNLPLARRDPASKVGQVRVESGGLEGARLHDFGDFSSEEALALNDVFDGGNEAVAEIGFQEVAVSAGVESALNHVVALVHREDENLGVGKGVADAARGFDAIELGHGEIQYGDIGLQGNGFFHGLTAIGSLADDTPTVTRVQDVACSAAHQGVIIGD